MTTSLPPVFPNAPVGVAVAAGVAVTLASVVGVGVAVAFDSVVGVGVSVAFGPIVGVGAAVGVVVGVGVAVAFGDGVVAGAAEDVGLTEGVSADPVGLTTFSDEMSGTLCSPCRSHFSSTPVLSPQPVRKAIARKTHKEMIPALFAAFRAKTDFSNSYPSHITSIPLSAVFCSKACLSLYQKGPES